MEFVAELFDRLENESKPFPKRFKLAQNAYYATGGSSEKIISWICSSLKSMADTDFNQFLTEWDKLVRSVHTQHVRLLVNIMIQSVTDHLKDYNRCIEENTFLYVVDILEISRVQSYFFTDLASYVSLVETLLNALAGGPKTDEYVCERLFQSMETFARLMSLREFPTLFIERLFLPSVHLVNTVGSHSPSLEQHLMSCVEKVVFFKNTQVMVAFFDSLFKAKKIKLEQEKEDIKKSQPHCKPGCKLLEKLHGVLNSDNPKDALLAYTTIFKCVLKLNNTNITCLKLLIALCPVLGIHVNNAKLKVELPAGLLGDKTSPNERSFLVFESILSITLSEGASMPDGNELQWVNWIECLWRTLLSLSLTLRQSGEYLRSLTALLQLHPRVVLNKKLSILTDLLVALTPDKEIPEFITFLHELLSIHQKRFTVHELLSSLFTNSKQLLNTRKRLNTGSIDVNFVVPPSVYADIQKYAADWPSTPVLDFVDFMITQLQTLSFTAENLRSVYTSSSTMIGVRLLSGVLTGARIVDHCGNEKIRLAYVTRFKSLCQVLKQMAAVAQTSEDEISIQSFLELECTWATVMTILQHYCPEAVQTILGEVKTENLGDETVTSAAAVTSLHRHITVDSWESIRTKVTSSEDIVSKRLLVRLETQSLRYLIITKPTSHLEATSVAESILPLLVSYADVDAMANDIGFTGNLLGTRCLKLLAEKLADLLLTSGEEESWKSFKRLQENKSLICGVVYSTLERLKGACSSESDWPTAQKMLAKFTKNDFEKLSDYSSDTWETVLMSLGKLLNKSLKKNEGAPKRNVTELSQIEKVLRVFNLQPLGYTPESLQTAVITVLLGLSVDLLTMEDSEEKSSIYDLIYHQLIFGILERWSVTTEAPSLQKYLDMALVISHVREVTKLRNPVDVSLVHTLLGLSARSEKSLNKVLDAFFSEDRLSAEDFVIRQEVLSIVCKDALSESCRAVLKTTDSAARVVSLMTSHIQSEQPKKQLISVYTLLLSRAHRKKDKLEDLVPHLEEYCRLAVKCIRKSGNSRRLGEEFFREILKYHELLEYLPENFLLDLWSALCEIDQPNSHIASLVFSWANKDLFERIMKSTLDNLENATDEFTACGNGLLLLESLIKSPLISDFTQERRHYAIMRFLSQQHIFLIYPPADLLKVLSSIVESSKVIMEILTADALFQALSTITSRRNRTENMELATAWFGILHGMLFHRSSQTFDCLPAFTAELRLLLHTIVYCSRQSQHLEECISVAQGIEKMFQTIVKAKMTRNFIRIGAYILADLVKHFESQLPQGLKVILENVACEILSFLDTYAQRFLGKVVNAESAEILREIGRIRALRRPKIV